MGVRMNVIKLLAVSALLACAACGGTKNSGEAKGPETNPWADYKGTYATAGGGSGASSASSKKSAKTEVAAAEAPKSEEPAAAPADETPAPAPAAPPPAKKGKTAGKGAKKKK